MSASGISVHDWEAIKAILRDLTRVHRLRILELCNKPQNDVVGLYMITKLQVGMPLPSRAAADDLHASSKVTRYWRNPYSVQKMRLKTLSNFISDMNSLTCKKVIPRAVQPQLYNTTWAISSSQVRYL